MKKSVIKFLTMSLLAMTPLLVSAQKNRVGLTLIPPSPITNKVEIDIRAGIVNNDDINKEIEIALFLNNEEQNSLLHYSKINLDAGKSHLVQHVLPTEDKVGMNKIILKVQIGEETYTETKELKIIESDIRSTRQIDGAWAGIYHWSETEGKHWNKDIKKMTDNQWRELVRSMNSLEMNMIVIQEVFRNEEYVGKHSLTVDNYDGKAFYPSELYPGRMPIAAEDPIEAILSEADRLDMTVMVGVGMFAWFDFTPESLEWHKRVAKELWEKYGHHPSFYAFYVSEESGGSLDNWESTKEAQIIRKHQIVEFFRAFKEYCNTLAPEKPIMLATNSMGILQGIDAYPALLQNLDILCPFGFARMPEGDLSGVEAANILQELCDEAGSHLWFDLETFLFNPDQSLYPRPMDEIIHDLTTFDNFEKILCYQYPGVFSDPNASIRVGEERTIKLFNDYSEYLNKLKKSRKERVKNEKNKISH
jgi:hypothetical protein